MTLHEDEHIQAALRAALQEALDTRRPLHLSLFDPSLPDVRPGQLPVLDQGGSGCLCEAHLVTVSDDGELNVTLPDCWQVESCMTPGRFIFGLVGRANQRVGFTTHVVAVKTNGERTTGLTLAAPAYPRRAQRREFCRVHVLDPETPLSRVWPLANLHQCPGIETMAMAVFRSTDRQEPRILPVPASAQPPAMAAAIVDISAGGVGLGMANGCVERLSREGWYWLELSLPQTPTSLPVVARCVHHRPRTEKTCQVGFQFVFLHHIRYRTFFVDEVCRFVAQIQQRLLRRQHDRRPGEREAG